MSKEKKVRVKKSAFENLSSMFSKAVNNGHKLDVSKLNADGTGSKVYKECNVDYIPVKNCRGPLTKMHIPNLSLVSDNADSYALAVSILKQGYESAAQKNLLDEYARKFRELYPNKILRSPSVKSPKSPKSPKRLPIIFPITTNPMIGSNLLKSPSTQDKIAGLAANGLTNKFASPRRSSNPPSPVRMSPVLSRPTSPIRMSPVLSGSSSPVRTSSPSRNSTILSGAPLAGLSSRNTNLQTGLGRNMLRPRRV